MPGHAAAMTAPDRLPLLVTADPALLDDLLAMSAAAGVDVVVADSPVAALARWASASLVLVGDDLLPDLALTGMPRRDAVVVCGRGVADHSSAPRRLDASTDSLWRQAVALGAAEVVDVAEGRSRIVDLIGDAIDGPLRSGPVITVVSGRGGAGASTLACALALVSEDCLLVDGDPLGGGLDLRVGGEDLRGLRWPELGATRGRVSPLALRDALPRQGGVSLVAASRDGAAPIPLDSLSAILEAGSRGYPLTIVDCPRHLDDACRFTWGRSRTAIVVVPDDVPGIVSSSILLDAVRSCVADIRLVIRRTRESVLSESDVSRALGQPILGCLPHDRAVARGEPLTSAGHALRRFAEGILVDCGVSRAARRPGARRRGGRSRAAGASSSTAGAQENARRSAS